MTDAQAHPLSDQRIFDVLLKRGLLSEVQLKQVKKRHGMIREKLESERAQKRRATGVRIANPVDVIDVLVAMELSRADKPSWPLDEGSIYQVLAEEWQLPFKRIDPLKLDLNIVTTTIPHKFAMKHLLLPIDKGENHLVVATPNPFNREGFEDLRRVIQMEVETVVSSKGDVRKCIGEFFGFKRSIAAAEDQFGGSAGVDLGNLEQYVKVSGVDEVPPNDQHIVTAVNHVLVYAFDQRASDIHIEPKRDEVLVRMRIDGVLHTVYKLPKKVHSAIISRIKTLARMDMAEKRRPQDGRIKTDRGGVEAEIRISTLPVAFGEKAVLRIMDPDILFRDLKGLGFSKTDLERYNRMVAMPHGVVLVCGPTGSGKSTTLYSTLRQLSSPDINITTIEDPIEMIHPDFNQIAVKPAVDIRFDNILRTILRQDPDIIMVGEMRDLDTANSAVQAALTGHLVLSTLHTNDAPSSLTRLLDMGVPYYMVQATVVGVLGQRLVRMICPYCKEAFQMELEELRAVGLNFGKKNGKVTLHHGTGCARCRNTGYRGRSGIYEVLPYTEKLKQLTTAKTDLAAVTREARREGMITMRENAIRKLVNGDTTYQEVLRVTWQQN
jgi:general secretion pathway protein E